MATKTKENYSEVVLGIVYNSIGEVEIADNISANNTDFSVDFSEYDQILTIKLPKRVRPVERKEVIVK